MTVTGSLIQTLHRINKQKADLEGQLRRGPKVVATAQAKLDAALQGAQDVQDRITQMKVDADAKQLQMKQREDKIHQWEGQLNAAKENREYQTLKDQIAADTQANLVLSDEILETLEGIDATEVELEDAKKQAELVRQDFEKIEQQIAAKRTTLEAELERVCGELAEAEKGLSGDIKRDYERLIAAKGEDAMAPAEDGCCSACYRSLTPQTQEQLAVGKPIPCPACGCLLYLP
ncbi:MAG: zinc ribbon domain-containing protein [Aureliella sp.]